MRARRFSEFDFGRGGVASGGAPGIVLSGSDWTPNRDGGGLVLTTDFPQLTLNTWFKVKKSGGGYETMQGVIETPHYPKAGTPPGGPDGSDGIVGAWGGAAWDYVNQRMLITGGGHGDTHECDTGVYGLTAAKCSFELLVGRNDISQVQSWNTSTHALQAQSVGNTGYNVPQQNGVPGSMHTYWGLIWMPPGSVGAGSVKGGLYYPGAARSIINLDSGAYTTTYWWSPDVLLDDVSNVKSFLDDTIIYRPYGNYYHLRWDTAQNEATTWSASSVGKQLSHPVQSGVMENTDLAYCWMRERREEVFFNSSYPFIRVRYGQAIDASASDWTAYTDTITLTSSDGSHSDFSSTALTQTLDGGNQKLYAAGMFYDHAATCIWVQANDVGGQLYKITGLSGTTWTIEKIAGTGALYSPNRGTFGRFQVATIGGVKVAIRVSSTTDPLQVMRIS